MARMVGEGDLPMVEGGDYERHYVTGVFRVIQYLDLDLPESVRHDARATRDAPTASVRG